MKDRLSAEDKKRLLIFSRKTIESIALKGRFPEPDEDLKKLSEKRGVFVTLSINKRLRGCIGNIFPEKELYAAIMENSKNSAYHDPRFNPLKPHEINDIEIEISILTPPEKIEYLDIKELKKKITPFEDGVILTFGMRKSTFLPQVWDELTDFDDFMSHLSIKAGLDQNAWKKLNPVVEVYRADHFSESDFF